MTPTHMTNAHPDHIPTSADAHERFAAILTIFRAHKASTDRANATFNLKLPYSPKTDWTPCVLTAELERQLLHAAHNLPDADLRDAETVICERAVARVRGEPWLLGLWQDQNRRPAANTQRTARAGNIKAAQPAQQRSRAKGAPAKTA